MKDNVSVWNLMLDAWCLINLWLAIFVKKTFKRLISRTPRFSGISLPEPARSAPKRKPALAPRTSARSRKRSSAPAFWP